MHGLEDNIVDKPLLACGIAAAAGFIMAGRMSTSLVLTILGLAGRKAARDTASNLVRDAVKPRML